MSADWYRWDGDTLILTLRIQPRASRDEIVGLHDGLLKVRITAPPVEGKANAHLAAFLARCFRVPKSQVSLLSGETGREKRIAVRAPRQIPPGLEIAQP